MTITNDDPLGSGASSAVPAIHADQEGVVGNITPKASTEPTGAAIRARVLETRPGDARALALVEQLADSVDAFGWSAVADKLAEFDPTNPVAVEIASDLLDHFTSPRS